MTAPASRSGPHRLHSSERTPLGGYQARPRRDARRLLADAHAVADAGAFAVVLEMVPGDCSTVTAELDIPTVGIGAGPDCDAQVLVWQDMAGCGAAGRSAS